MPFSIKKAAQNIDSVEIDFHGQTVKAEYNSGSKFKTFRKVAERREIAYLVLAKRLQTLMGDERVEEKKIDEVAEQMGRARRELAEAACMVITSWNLTGNLSEIAEEFYAGLTEDEARALDPEDRKKLDSAEDKDAQKLPVDGLWLYALPLPDDFIQRILTAINEDYDAGGATAKKP